MNNGCFKKKKTRIVNGIKVSTVETEIASQYNALSVEAGTTGLRGGNEQKGGRAYIRICDASNSSIEVLKDATGKGFVLRASGDCEISTLIDALDFCSRELKRQCSEQKQKTPDSIAYASKKQLTFLRSLAEKNNYRLVNNRISTKDAGCLIKYFTGETDHFPDWAETVLIKNK